MKFALRKISAVVALAALFFIEAWPVAQVSGQSRRSGASTNLGIPPPTTARARLDSFERKSTVARDSPLRSLPLRSIGPTVMSGRVVDVEVSPDDPTIFYVAYATGGLWKTVSNGSHFSPLSDRYATAGIGDIAVRWGDPDVVWVGTGESNSSRSVVPGAGLYRTRDRGGQWDYLGLAETHGIGKVLLSPVDTSVIYVAALGHLYTKNSERGVFKTTDGGKTWRATLQIDDSTGVVDLIMDPEDPQILYAAAWHRSRKAWDFVEGGSSSGVYTSVDGGETWSLLSTGESGFPVGDEVGRIGLAVAPETPEILYAVVDNQTAIPREGRMPSLTYDALHEMSSERLLTDFTDDEIQAYLDRYDFPDAYDAPVVRRLIEEDEIEPSDLAKWVGETTRRAYDRDVVGCEVYRSEDRGRRWRRTNEKRLENVCETYGYYFGRITVDPADADKIYLAGVPLLKSEDGGRTFTNIARDNVHLDHHVLWIDSGRPGHLINGNDGGLNLSYDDGLTWFKLNAPPVGQFYTVNFDMAQPFNVYGGLQDNGVWFGPSDYEASTDWQGEGNYPYRRLLGGDGMMVDVSRSDDNVVYAGEQFGDYYRVTRDPAESTSIKPYARLGDEPLRFNWLTPIHLSIHNDQILYIGSQRVHRSMDGGTTWQDISEDLTKGPRQGDVPFGTLTALDESPLRFGVLYAGSDDGLVHATKDGGVNWVPVSQGLPQNMWVSRLEASSHELGRVYLALNGSRWDVMDPMAYVSEDFGRDWQQIGRNLPLEPINVIREDPVNENVLFVGTDNGLYVSLDRGKQFFPASEDLPVVPVHDLRIQPASHELLIATHGRSLYAGDISALEKLTASLMDAPLFAFRPDTVWYDANWGNSDPAWQDADVPDALFVFWARKSGTVTVSIQEQDGDEWISLERRAQRGLNYVHHDLSIPAENVEEYLKVHKASEQAAGAASDEPRDNGKYYLSAGSYDVRIGMNSEIATTVLVVAE